MNLSVVEIAPDDPRLLRPLDFWQHERWVILDDDYPYSRPYDDYPVLFASKEEAEAGLELLAIHRLHQKLGIVTSQGGPTYRPSSDGKFGAFMAGFFLGGA